MKPQLLHLIVVPFQMVASIFFQKNNMCTNVWLHLSDVPLELQDLCTEPRCWAFSWRTASLKLSSWMCSVMALVVCMRCAPWICSWSGGQPGNPSCLLTPSSPSFDWRGETPAAPFQQILAMRLPVVNPLLAKDLMPCEMWSHTGYDIWEGKEMLLGRRKRVGG